MKSVRRNVWAVIIQNGWNSLWVAYEVDIREHSTFMVSNPSLLTLSLLTLPTKGILEYIFVPIVIDISDQMMQIK